MNEIDRLSNELLEEAKRFLEKAILASTGSAERGAYAHAALLLGFSSLEAHLNAVAEELAARPNLGVLDHSILTERDFTLDDGRFQLTSRLKMYHLEDRLLYIVANFSPSGSQSPTTSAWWRKLKAGTDLRNQLVHPKAKVQVDLAAVANALTAILECLDSVYQAVFTRPFPSAKRGLRPFDFSDGSQGSRCVQAALARCGELATLHVERANTGGLREAKLEEQQNFAAKKAQRVAKQERTLGKLLEAYVDHLKTQERRSHYDANNIFRLHVEVAFPQLWATPAADVTPGMILDTMRRLIAQKKGRTSNKLRSYLASAYQCAVDVESRASIPQGVQTVRDRT